VIVRIAKLFDVSDAELTQGVRRCPVAAARAAVGAVAVRGLGLPARRIGAALGVTGMAILRGLPRGREHLRRLGIDPERLAQNVLRKGE